MEEKIAKLIVSDGLLKFEVLETDVYHAFFLFLLIFLNEVLEGRLSDVDKHFKSENWRIVIKY